MIASNLLWQLKTIANTNAPFLIRRSNEAFSFSSWSLDIEKFQEYINDICPVNRGEPEQVRYCLKYLSSVVSDGVEGMCLVNRGPNGWQRVWTDEAIAYLEEERLVEIQSRLFTLRTGYLADGTELPADYKPCLRGMREHLRSLYPIYNASSNDINTRNYIEYTLQKHFREQVNDVFRKYLSDKKRGV